MTATYALIVVRCVHVTEHCEITFPAIMPLNGYS